MDLFSNENKLDKNKKMAFVLTLRNSVNRADGAHIDKGAAFLINIPVMGITPTNLFGNSRCKDQLIKQLLLHRIDLPKNDPLYNNKGYWDIKMV